MVIAKINWLAKIKCKTCGLDRFEDTETVGVKMENETLILFNLLRQWKSNCCPIRSILPNLSFTENKLIQ